MKRLFVFVPATLLVLFLLSFVLKEKDKSGLVNIVFKSTDGGQTWQDIRLFTRVGTRFSDEHNSVAPSNYWSINLKKTNGTSIWLPVFESTQDPRFRTVFETAGGTIFVGVARGFFKIANNGRTWKHVHNGSLVGHMAESNGVLLAISMRKIIRSTDDGENWSVVSNEGVVAWDVKQVQGGFVAITSSSESGPRRLMKSYDAGKSWQPIEDAKDSIWRTWNDRPNLKVSMTPIIQIEGNYLCTHPDGIFRSADKGKTWKLLLPSVDNKVFNLFVSGNVVYAILSRGGC
jgi:photosystem II stability/assembly factor-like uncharacterized protein